MPGIILFQNHDTRGILALDLGAVETPPNYGPFPRTKVVTDKKVSVATFKDNMGGHFP